ncbi:hypothetical protein D3C72_2360610 [compost metagenome]
MRVSMPRLIQPFTEKFVRRPERRSVACTSIIAEPVATVATPVTGQAPTLGSVDEAHVRWS